MNIILFDELPAGMVLANDDFRAEHIRKVLRLQAGDSFSMGILNGPCGIATIEAMDSTGITFGWQPQESRSELHGVTLLVAQVRPICMKRILREAVSLGVAELLVVGADTAERSYADAKLWSTGEYRKYLLDGAMQSGQTGMPSFRLVESVGSALVESDRWKTRILMDNVLAGEPLPQMENPEAPLVVAVGPERGWTERERKLFLEHGFVPKSMGNRILRTETACSAALAIVLGRMGLL
ncbi:MAG: 16S rRNA (uracil(1498)-N(3))-methyltransferase [Sphaerochaetaceae bacterium]